MGDPVGQADALQPGARHDQGVGRTDLAAAGQPLQLAVIEFAHARIGGAAKRITSISENSRHTYAARRTALVPIRKPLPPEFADLLERHAGAQHQRIGRRSRARVAPITRPGVSSLPGMSLSECIAACSLPALTAAQSQRRKRRPCRHASATCWTVGIPDGFELDDFDVELRRRRLQPPGNFLGLGQRHDALARADTH